MATITKVTRRRHENPPHGVATVKEWFNYVTAMRNEGKCCTLNGSVPNLVSCLAVFCLYCNIVNILVVVFKKQKTRR